MQQAGRLPAPPILQRLTLSGMCSGEVHPLNGILCYADSFSSSLR